MERRDVATSNGQGARNVDGPAVTIPVSRGRALSRAVIWVVPATLLTLASVVIYPNLEWTAPSGLNRLVAYSTAIIALPVPLGASWCAWRMIRYLLLALWPARLAVRADARGLVLTLGPFGTRRYDADRLAVAYPFEQSEDKTDGGFEAFLPEEEQRKRFLPRMIHPAASESIDRTLLHFCPGDETSLAARLRPVIEVWRAARRAKAKNEESAHAP